MDEQDLELRAVAAMQEDAGAALGHVTSLADAAQYGDDTRGRIERRVIKGRTTSSGRIDPDVVSVTLKTPRDVRTLVPSRRDHLILAVYEGTFPTGTVTATSHLRDGKDVTRSVYVG